MLYRSGHLIWAESREAGAAGIFKGHLDTSALHGAKVDLYNTTRHHFAIKIRPHTAAASTSSPPHASASPLRAPALQRSRIYVLAAANKEDRDVWYQQLRAVCHDKR